MINLFGKRGRLYPKRIPPAPPRPQPPKVSLRLYEILIPATDNEGRNYHVDYHRKCDEWITQRIGGLTILNSTYKGKWFNKDKAEEIPVIAVRVACEPTTILEVMRFTQAFYRQESIMAYEISSNVLFVNGDWRA